MKYHFKINCDHPPKFIRLHNWVINQGWQIKIDYEWTTVIGYRDNRTVEIQFDDPQKAMLFKLTWA